MQMLDILKSLSLKNIEGYGNLISYSDIFRACKLQGQDNSEVIQLLLHQLENQNVLAIVHMTDPGFEDLIIGVTLS